MACDRESNEESFERADEDTWEDGAECPACGGEAFVLGVLGKLKWYRCRNCGFDLGKGAL